MSGRPGPRDPAPPGDSGPWPATGSGPVVPVAPPSAVVADAYAVFLAHFADGGTCADCAGVPQGRCAVAEPLWQAYKAACRA